MSPASIRAHILQSPNVVLHCLARVVLDCHGRQLGCKLEDRLGGEGLDTLAREDGVLGHDAFGGLRAKGEEGHQGFLFCRGNGVSGGLSMGTTGQGRRRALTSFFSPKLTPSMKTCRESVCYSKISRGRSRVRTAILRGVVSGSPRSGNHWGLKAVV